MPQSTGDITAIVTIVGSVFAFLGITGIDSAVVNSAVTGIISLVSIVAAVHAYYSRPSAPQSTS
jgi:hypothetical protein